MKKTENEKHYKTIYILFYEKIDLSFSAFSISISFKQLNPCISCDATFRSVNL
uniref:Uncharacterized protein n=1 Tax=Arundo donax TaxID=35708 RepID=A0A0A9AF59_ARUDO